jgi:uncharacterized protein (DUF1810 family)
MSFGRVSQTSLHTAAPEAVAEQDPYDLRRFVTAQKQVYPGVLAELRAGRKQSHWMWFIFPQIAGLGRSEMAQRFSLSGKPEAAAYLAHPLLGARLRECTELVLDAPQSLTAEQIFGYPDDLKFRSSMTLVAEVANEPGIFGRALERYFGGRPDEATLRLLRAAGERSG